MFGVNRKELDIINTVSKALDPSVDSEIIGQWGILHLVCGALYGQTLTGKSAVLEGLPSPHELFHQHLSSNLGAETTAMLFSKHIKEWAQNKDAEKIMRNRLFSSKNTMTQKQYDYLLYYTTLAFMLNSVHNQNYKDFNKVQIWAEKNNYGWEKVFFGAGLLLNNERDFHWERYGSMIKSMSGEAKEQVNELFRHFQNSR